MLMLALLVAACVPSTDPLRTRAAFDFKCPEDQVHLHELSRFQQGVEGCGRRGVYVYTTSGWVLNSDEGQAAK
jgi:hypothetical protein